MRRTRVSLLVLVCAGAMSLSALPSAAAPRLSAAKRRQARSLADEGLNLFRKGSYQQALDSFQQAEDIVHAPTHLLFIARSQDKLGQLLASRDTYHRIVGEQLGRKAPKAFVKARQNAEQELAAVEAAIPSVAIAIEGASVETTRVFVDDREVTSLELPLDPGSYTIRAQAEGYDQAETTVVLSRGDGVKRMSLSLTPLATEPPPPPTESEVPLAPVLVMAGGTALLIVGAVTGGLALDKASDLKRACPSNPCPTQYESLRRDANTFATVSTATLTAGGVAFAAGGGWLLYDLFNESDDDAEQARVMPWVSPTSMGVSGAF